MRSIPRMFFALLFLISAHCVDTIPINQVFAEDQSTLLVRDLEPWLACLTGKKDRYSLRGNARIKIDGKPQEIEMQFDLFDDESFDLKLSHPEYAVHFRRRLDGIAMALPKHQIVYLGSGDIDSEDNLKPNGMVSRLVSSGTSLQLVTRMIHSTESIDLASMVIGLAKLSFNTEKRSWNGGESSLTFADQGKSVQGTIDGTTFEMKISDSLPKPEAFDQWGSMQIKSMPRKELERHLARGLRRALEVASPSPKLTSPTPSEKTIAHGQIRWVNGSRVVLLSGTSEEIGQAHGKLLKVEANRCVDSVVYMFGTVQTIATGRWFRDDLEAAYRRLAPYIPERHKVETRALAASLGLDQRLIETTNVFPELFHCSGFALFGKATTDGKLYHGRVLDYMTTIGLQDSAVTFIVAPDGYIPFANVGYAGFIGSVSGMNREKISLGEMGGRGEGQWDGAPMATLMRRGLEECRSLDAVKDLWKNNPRTCEYYYVFADGKSKTAVGVAATPEKLEFIEPGTGHPLLGEGIPDAVVLSAGTRLDLLRARVQEQYGKIDANAAQNLMSRPVAMDSNLHNVLFVPEDGVFYVANADHKQPAADRPYTKLDLNQLLDSMKKSSSPTAAPAVGSMFHTKDSFNPPVETKADAIACLEGLRWEPSSFDVWLETAEERHGDLLVRFPSSVPSGDTINDLVAMEWYQAKDKNKNPIQAPAAVIVHESGSGMAVGRLIANGLRQKGVHTFMIQLPHYGKRRGPQGKPIGDQLFVAMKQGIADVRRAKDAVAAIPLVDSTRISLQGTSLGGFVTATTAGLDPAYHRVFVLLAGGDLFDVIMNGKRDAVKMRQELQEGGVSEEKLKKLLDTVEPLRLAHRLDPSNTWIFSGKYDDVVPLANCQRLAKAASLDEDHHITMLADHYLGVLYLPTVIQQIHDHMIESPRN